MSIKVQSENSPDNMKLVVVNEYEVAGRVKLFPAYLHLAY